MPDRVVDASALVALTFGEVRADEVDRAIRGHTPHAPTLLPYELANAARTKIRRDPDDRERLEQALRYGAAFSVTLHPVDLAAALFLSLQSGLTVYDASYLWLAQRLGAPLVTLDGALAEVARGRGLLGMG